MILDYIETPTEDRVNHSDFLERPFSSFLRQSVNLFDAFNQCRRHFPKKKDDDFRKDSLHSLHEIASPIIASLMSNLELFQRSLFGGIFDLTGSIPGYDVETIATAFNNKNLRIGTYHVLGYRGTQTAAGGIFADALSKWQDPKKVNEYFYTLLGLKDFYSVSQCTELEIFWQLRHSIVHTGGTLTVPDSQKKPPLSGFGNKAVVFRPQVIEWAVVYFHKLLKEVRNDFYPRVTSRFGAGHSGQVRKDLNRLFELESPRKYWLR